MQPKYSGMKKIVVENVNLAALFWQRPVTHAPFAEPVYKLLHCASYKGRTVPPAQGAVMPPNQHLYKKSEMARIFPTCVKPQT